VKIIVLLKLLLPAVFPSWRFFSSIGPSPRIEIAFTSADTSLLSNWQPVNQLPKKMNFVGGMLRLLHNPDWNEYLYMNTCAERIMEQNTAFYVDDIAKRLIAATEAGKLVDARTNQMLMFRIRAITNDNLAGDELAIGNVSDEVVFVSQPYALPIRGEAI
jgi:hypothetical protein